METTYNENIMDASASVLSNEYNIKSVSISIILILAGLVLMIGMILFVYDHTSSTFLFAIISSITLMCIGAIKLLFGSKTLVYTPTKSQIKEHSIFFKSETLETLVVAIENFDMQTIKRLAVKANSGVRLDVFISTDRSFGVCQVYHYVPHNYEIASSVYSVPQDKIDAFCNCIDDLI